MESHVIAGDYKDIVLFLATAGVVVPLFRRWRINPILGFLGAGVVLSPYGLGALGDQAPWLSYVTISNPELGALQVSLSLAAIAGVGMAFGLSPLAAVAVGAALALSSTAVVMQILTEHRRQHSTAGRATFSVLLFQDLAVAPILVTLALLARGGEAEVSPKLLLAGRHLLGELRFAQQRFSCTHPNSSCRISFGRRGLACRK